MNQTAEHLESPPRGQVGRFGMVLFLAALFMLFFSAIMGYVLIRTQLLNPNRSPDPPLGTLKVPMFLWLSTFVILVSSVSLQYALVSVRAGNRSAFRKAMGMTLALAGLFLVIQAPCLVILFITHAAAVSDNIYLYSLIAVLILIHAAHVVGGIIPLGKVTAGAFANRYDPLNHDPVVYMTMYWHFIDVVWLIMFNVFVFLG